MSYYSRMQMNVNWFLEFKYRKIDFNLKKEDVDYTLHQIVESIIRGVQDYKSVFNGNEHSNMFYKITAWCSDIADYLYENTDVRQYFWKRYKIIMKQYFDIDEFNNKHEFIKDGKNLQRQENMTAEDFKKYCLFDAEEMYKKGILNRDILDRCFNHDKKYYMVNHFHPCVYDKVFTYNELVEFLEGKYEYCTIPKDNIISIYHISRNENVESYENYIVCEEQFKDMKSVDGYLSKVNFNEGHFGKLMDDLNRWFDEEKVMYYMQKFYDFSSLKSIEKYGKILKSGNRDKLEKVFELFFNCFTLNERIEYLQEIDNKLGNGEYFTKVDWMNFGRYIRY